MVTINTNTVRNNVFKTVYDVLNTDSDIITAGATVVQSFPILSNPDKLSFPIISIMTPFVSDESFINIKESYNMQDIVVQIEIGAISGKSVQDTMDLVDKAINENKSVFRNVGLKNLKTRDNTTPDPIQVNERKRIHVTSLIIEASRTR